MPELVIDQRRRDLGGFEVGRILPAVQRRMVGPFVFFDHMGPVDFPAGIPRTVDVRPHPHIGLATVTYLFEGEIMHRDSLASQQPIRAGEVNWMTAGSGITHSERFERARQVGGRLHGIQAWVALPEGQEEIAPAFHHHEGADLPTYEGGGLWARLIAGEAFGARAKVHTHSPMFYVHWQLAAGATAQLPAQYLERAAYVASGTVEVDGQRFGAGKMLVFAPGKPVLFSAPEPATVMLLGGEPVGERFVEWNFVSSSRARIEQAKADWAAGRMKLPDFDNQEFIPLPDSPGRAPPPALDVDAVAVRRPHGPVADSDGTRHAPRSAAEKSALEDDMATPEQLKGKFWQALAAQRTVMLGLDGVEDNHTRPMTALFEDDSSPIWFFTSTDNAMVKAHQQHGRAIATYAAKGHELFATVHGQLSQELDRAVIDRLWSPFVAAWYEGREDPKLAVLRLDAEHAEIWLNDASILAGVKILLGADPRKVFEGKVARVPMDH